MQKTVTFFFIADYSKSAWQSKEKNSAFLQKNYGIFVKLPYKAKENEKNDHLQKEADSLY